MSLLAETNLRRIKYYSLGGLDDLKAECYCGTNLKMNPLRQQAKTVEAGLDLKH